MTAQIITFPGSMPASAPKMSAQVYAAIGDFLSLMSEASDHEIEVARVVLMDASFRASHQQMPLIKSRKKVDRREKQRLEVMRRAFCDASFIIRAEQERREI